VYQSTALCAFNNIIAIGELLSENKWLQRKQVVPNAQILSSSRDVPSNIEDITVPTETVSYVNNHYLTKSESQSETKE
jgi:hypothetical protein